MLRTDRRQPDSGIPTGLPDHLRYPVIPLDPELNEANRRFQAFREFGRYSRDLSTWLTEHGHGRLTVPAVQAALGTGLDEFLRVADEAGRHDIGSTDAIVQAADDPGHHISSTDVIVQAADEVDNR